MNPNESETIVEIGPVTTPLAPPTRKRSAPTAEEAKLRSRIQRLLPWALSAPALAIPLVWPFVALAMRIVLDARAKGRGERASVAMAAALGGLVSKFAPQVIALVVFLIISVVASAAALFCLGALSWLAFHEVSGALVSGRLFAYEHLLGVVSLLACRRMLGWHRSRPVSGRFDELGAILAPRGGGSVFTLVGLAAVIGVFALVVPSTPWAPWGSLASLTQSLPAGLRDTAVNAQRSLIEEGSKNVVQCLENRRNPVGWRFASVRDLPEGRFRVSIVRDPVGESTRGDVTALVLALHQQLPESVILLSVRRRSNFDALTIDRSTVPVTGPIDDTKALASAAGVSTAVLPNEDRALGDARACGARGL